MADRARRPVILERGPSLADTLASRLREEIGEGRLAAGAKLPSEHEISDAYGVSRPTVREAIGRLKHDGLVVTRQGSGVFVAEAGAPPVFRLEVTDFADKDDIANVVAFLMAVEAAATELAARRRSAADLAAIRAQLDAMQAAIERGDPGVDEDVAFHRAIVEATGNPYFREFSNFLDRKVRHFIRTARQNSARHDGLTQAVQVEHVRIFEALEKGDAAAARTAAEQHVRNAAARLQLYLER